MQPNGITCLALPDGEGLSGIVSKIHRLSAKFIRSQLDAEKPIWWNYWDYCPRDGRLFRLNYLFNNPKNKPNRSVDGVANPNWLRSFHIKLSGLL